jgi:hypothetical protein
MDAMDAMDQHGVYIVAAVGAVTVCALYLLLRTDVEAPVPYSIEPPEQARPGWKGDVLDEPTFKVRLLGQTKPTIPKLTSTGLGLGPDPMLCPRDRRGPRTREPLDRRWH